MKKTIKHERLQKYLAFGLSVCLLLTMNASVYAHNDLMMEAPDPNEVIEFPPIEDDIAALAQYGQKAQQAGNRLVAQGSAILSQAHDALQSPEANFQQQLQLITVLGEIGEPSSVDVIIEVAEASPNKFLYQNVLLSLAKFEQTDDIVAFANKQLAADDREPLVQRSAMAYFAQQPHADAIQWVERYAQDSVNEEVRFAALYLAGKLGVEQYKNDIANLLNQGVGSIARQYYLLVGLVELTDIDEFNALTQDLKFFSRNREKIDRYLQFRKGDPNQRVSLAKTMLSGNDNAQRMAAVDYLIEEKNADALAKHWKFRDPFVTAAVKRAGYEIEIHDDDAHFKQIHRPHGMPVKWFVAIAISLALLIVAIVFYRKRHRA